MKFLNCFNIKEVGEYLKLNYRYQKVVIISLKEEKEEVDSLIKIINRDCQIFEYSCEQILNFEELDFIDAYVYVVFCGGDIAGEIIKKIPKEFKLVAIVNTFALPIFDFKREGLVLINYNYKKSLVDLMLMTTELINFKWQNLLGFKNYGLELKMLDVLFDSFDYDDNRAFLNKLFKIGKEIKIDIQNWELFEVKKSVKQNFESYFAYYCYIKIMTLEFLFRLSESGQTFICDAYTDFENNIGAINAIYNIYYDERINFVLKNCFNNMLELFNKIFNKLNKYSKINNAEFNKILKILKNNAKISKNDDLLKISYVFGVFN